MCVDVPLVVQQQSSSSTDAVAGASGVAGVQQYRTTCTAVSVSNKTQLLDGFTAVYDAYSIALECKYSSSSFISCFRLPCYCCVYPVFFLSPESCVTPALLLQCYQQYCCYRCPVVSCSTPLYCCSVIRLRTRLGKVVAAHVGNSLGMTRTRKRSPAQQVRVRFHLWMAQCCQHLYFTRNRRNLPLLLMKAPPTPERPHNASLSSVCITLDACWCGPHLDSTAEYLVVSTSPR